MNCNLLIVDDDPNIRLGLQHMIQNHFQNQLAVSSCENGSIATKLLSDDSYDIVITDIKMPLCSGIELLKNMKLLELSCQTIVLSGYDDYNLIRDALRLGAVDYLLKPVDFGLLYHNLTNIINVLNIEKKVPPTTEKNPLRSQTLLESFLLKDNQNDSDCGNFISQYHIHQDTPCLLGYVDLKNILHSKRISILRFLTNTLEQHCNSCSKELLLLNGEIQSYWVFLGFWQSNNSMKNELLAPFARELAKERLHFSFVAAPFPLQLLQSAKQECRLGFERYYFDLPYDSFCFSAEKLSTHCNTQMGIHMDISAFLEKAAIAVAAYDYAKALKCMTHVFAAFHAQKPPITSVQKTLTNFIYDILSKNSKYIAIISSSKFTEHDILEQIESAHCLSVLQKQFFTSINHMIELATENLSNKEEYIIRRAKEYIASNYQESITLNDVAAHVFLQSTYFSAVFKTKTGITFRHFLRSYRMDKAKNLMKTGNYRICDIALAVGYSDSAHFVRAFKEVVGTSPSHYRQL